MINFYRSYKRKLIAHYPFTAEKRLLGVLLFELHAAITETGKRTGNPEKFHSALTVNIPFQITTKIFYFDFRNQEIF